jgi:two-component system cell cycle sensor histidine kinase/response regulator CckA
MSTRASNGLGGVKRIFPKSTRGYRLRPKVQEYVMGAAGKATVGSSRANHGNALSYDAELRLTSLSAGAAIGIATCTLDGRLLEGNAALSKMLGYSRQELAGKPIRELRSGDSPGDDGLDELNQGKGDSTRQESRYRRKDGTCFWGRLTTSVVHDAEGGEAFLIALLEDATEDRGAAEAFREAEKMEVIGRLAGGIVHDFNNLLTGVLLYCDLLSDGIGADTPLFQHVEEIRMAGEQGAALTQQLLASARKQVIQPRPISINDLVISTQNLLGRLIGEQIEIVTVLAPKLPTVLADPGQLRQVVLNIVLNARDSMPHGGCITVRTRVDPRVHGGPAMVALLVEDTGCGMDEQTRARLFEPFFTTKPAGQGTGLGLATVQRIVSESGGTIEVESEPGQGTRIQVSFPAFEANPDSPLPVSGCVSAKTILLVDDHPGARNSMQRFLHHAGYSVLTGCSGEQALQIFGERAPDIDLLLAGWTTPGMSGHELAQKMRQQKPDLKVLLISSGHDSRDESPLQSVESIQQPFAGGVLLERIREVLNSKGDSPW